MVGDGALAQSVALPIHEIRWIPFLPLAAAVLHGVLLVFVRRGVSRALVCTISCAAPIFAFLVTCRLFFLLVGLPAEERLLVDEVFLWIGAGHFNAGLSFLFDPLAAVLTLIVTGIGSLIHIYSIGYMGADDRSDGGVQRFFCYLNLFTAAMLFLVLGENLLVMFLGWEGVGLCSYLLIGFWYGDRWNAFCGTKAFIVNRIGDFGFLVALFLLFWAMADLGHASVSFGALRDQMGALAERSVSVPAFFPGPTEWRFTTLVGLALFLGAAGKSAQIPLYVWLPDAMAGPTPVSALIHAATMVTAGVYMVCRLSFLYAEAPGASALIAWTGGVTALFAATIAVAQTDLKKVLAYSTVSQLGYMFVAAGCGAYTAAIFHVTTHAFFKALLFLAAGSVILAMHHEQDTEKMGGLARRLPLTHATFLVGVLAIAGFPGLSGFFSKDEVLLSAWLAEGVPGHRALYWVCLSTAALTALYMFRVHARTFWGKNRAPREVQAHVREPAATVTSPLVALATLSVVGGAIGLPQVWGNLIGIPRSNSIANFLEGAVVKTPHHASQGLEFALAGAAIGAMAIGFLLGYWLYVRWPGLPGRISKVLGPVFRLVRNKFYVDEAIDAILVRPLVGISDTVLYRFVDMRLIDGLGAHGSAQLVRASAARVLKYAQSGFAQGYLFAMVLGGAVMVAWLVVAP